jgi:hypothetical protein
MCDFILSLAPFLTNMDTAVFHKLRITGFYTRCSLSVGSWPHGRSPANWILPQLCFSIGVLLL